MTFKVFLSKDAFKNIPDGRKNQIKDALSVLEDPLPGGNKKEIEGSKGYFRLRIGNFRAIYKVDFENKTVYVVEILTAQQAHKRYGNI
jgi:mRNA interferase RelE/StbE